MKKLIKYFKAYWPVHLYAIVCIVFIYGIFSGFIPGIIWTPILVLWVLIHGYIIFNVYPRKGALYFYNKNGRFEVFDIVYDRGSAVRPTIPGILKNNGQGWFLVYEDGFEWPISETKNIEIFNP